MTQDKHKPQRKASPRRARTDGDMTRARILEAAGQIFAERGYHDSTSKAICARAGTNIAAVNYHFGSRDGLYLAVMSEVMRHLLSLDYMAQIANSNATAEEKLSEMIEGMVHSLIEERSWHARVWAREILTPSPLLPQIMSSETVPRIDLLKPIIAQIANLERDDPRLIHCLLGTMAPCLMLMIINPDLPTPLQPIFQRPAAETADNLKQFVFAGIRGINQQ